MIFLTVGTQFNFDRLVKTVNVWNSNKQEVVVGQVGKTNSIFSNIKCHESLTPDLYNKVFLDADIIVSHAGMGSIISALSYNKPIIIMPRDSKLGEHRNQHQFSTCDQFSEISGCYVARNDIELIHLLNNRNQLECGVMTNSAAAFNTELKKLFKSL